MNDFPGQSRIDATTFVIDGFGYIGCGFDGTNHLKDFWKYNPNNDSWIEIESLPGLIRRQPFSFSLNSKGYCGGGVNTDNWTPLFDL